MADVHAVEAASLMKLGQPFDGFVEHTRRVSPTCLVTFGRNRYSVPASFANRPVSLRVYPRRLVRQLHRGDFMASADNVVLIGEPGTGKITSRPPLRSRPSNIVAKSPLLLHR